MTTVDVAMPASAFTRDQWFRLTLGMRRTWWEISNYGKERNPATEAFIRAAGQYLRSLDAPMIFDAKDLES